jgi:hypothetical protein
MDGFMNRYYLAIIKQIKQLANFKNRYLTTSKARQGTKKADGEPSAF